MPVRGPVDGARRGIPPDADRRWRGRRARSRVDTELERTPQGEERRRGRLPGAALVCIGEHTPSEPGIHGGRDHVGNGSLLSAMIDHILVDLITQTRSALENALLQRQAVEERFQVDVFLGDVSWETSYSLPGEEKPPRVRADLSLDWPTWSQSAYRSWSIGEPPDDLPEVVLEITLRVQRLASMPDLAAVVACLPEESPAIGADTLVRAAPVVEQVHEPAAIRDSRSRRPIRGRFDWTRRPSTTPPPWRGRWGRSVAGWPRSSCASVTSTSHTFRPRRRAPPEKTAPLRRHRAPPETPRRGHSS